MPYFYISCGRRVKATKHVYIAVPTTTGDIKAGCVNSLNAVQHNLLSNDISVDVAILAGCCHVDDARNDLCRMFLESEATHLMFIDSDVEFSSKSVATLLSFNENIVCGVYPFKNDKLDFPVHFHDPKNIQFNDKGLIDVKGVPGGFMCIEREVIQKLYDKNKSKGSWESKGFFYGKMPIVEIFHRTIHMGRTRRSGDLEFCAKAIRAGYKVYVAPNLDFSHIGDNRWKGCLQTFLLRNTGYYEKNAKAALGRISKGNPVLEDFEVVTKAFANEPYACDHVLLSVLYDTVKEFGHPSVLETGSGVSTAIMQAAGGVVVSLESEPMWGKKTEHFLDSVSQSTGQASPVFYVPMIDHKDIGRWYDAADYDGEFDVVFCDGPKPDEDGIRARICDIMPEALKSCKVIIIDDTDDQDGHNFLKRLNKEYGFVFDLHKGPRREFAVGTK